MEIGERAEDEQAAVIHWMLNLYLEHGNDWRTVAQVFLESGKAQQHGEDVG